MTKYKFVEEAPGNTIEVKLGLLVKKAGGTYLLVSAGQNSYLLVNVKTGLRYNALMSDNVSYWTQRLNMDDFEPAFNVTLSEVVEDLF